MTKGSQVLGITCFLFIILIAFYNREYPSEVGGSYRHPKSKGILSNLNESSGYNNGESMTNFPFPLKTIDEVENLTSPTATILMYNRVPKCGSTTMSVVIERLVRLNHFDLNKSLSMPRTRSKALQRQVINDILNRGEKSLHAWITHAFFFDDVGNDNGRLIWMNIVRDPVERFISHFYFDKIREPFRIKRLQEWGVDPKEYFRLNLDKCIAQNHPLCTWSIYPYGELQLSFFCGQDPACRERGNRWALQRALYHVDKYYSVVGLLEELTLSHAVLEAYIPKFFGGLHTIKAEKVKENISKPKKKKTASNATREILRNNLKEDYEFYEYLRQRLYAQARAIGLQPNGTSSSPS